VWWGWGVGGGEREAVPHHASKCHGCFESSLADVHVTSALAGRHKPILIDALAVIQASLWSVMDACGICLHYPLLLAHLWPEDPPDNVYCLAA
jgi:hypothetical protein